MAYGRLKLVSSATGATMNTNHEWSEARTGICSRAVTATVELDMSEIIQFEHEHFSVAFFVFSERVTPGSCVEVLETCQSGPKTLWHRM